MSRGFARGAPIAAVAIGAAETVVAMNVSLTESGRWGGQARLCERQMT